LLIGEVNPRNNLPFPSRCKPNDLKLTGSSRAFNLAMVFQLRIYVIPDRWRNGKAKEGRSGTKMFADRDLFGNWIALPVDKRPKAELHEESQKACEESLELRSSAYILRLSLRTMYISSVWSTCGLQDIVVLSRSLSLKSNH